MLLLKIKKKKLALENEQIKEALDCVNKIKKFNVPIWVRL